MEPSAHLVVVPPPRDDDELEPGFVLGSYRVERKLGEGAMGKVYLGRHVTLERPAALKVLHPHLTRDAALTQRFLQEARLVSRINHEHIVEVFDFVESLEPALVYAVMELLDGQTLSERLAASPVSLSSVLNIGRQAAQALHAAHAVGVVHRDVKPENLFLAKRGGRDDFVKVLDFGVAKLTASTGYSSVTTSHGGGPIGTPRYMAPEQAAGLEVDARTDVYAMGTVLYEMLAGHVPFPSAAFGQLAADIITKAPPPLPERSVAGEAIPPVLRDLVFACLKKSPQERPPSMAAVEQWLVNVLGEGPPPPVRVTRATRAVVGLGAALGMLGLGLALFFSFRDGPSPVPVPMPMLLPAPVDPVAKVSAPAAEVHVVVNTAPDGAQVLRTDTGEVLGVTPLTLLLPRSDGLLPLTLKAPGYEVLERQVPLAADLRLELELKPSSAPRAATQKPAPGQKKPKPNLRNGVIDPF